MPSLLAGVKPRLLDLFCGAGGAARGYQNAGFHVVGVDKEPQPRYAGNEFVQGDALEFMEALLEGGRLDPALTGFDAIHASPPCQAYSAGLAMPGVRGERANLIPPIRERLIESGLPYVIENVRRSPLRDPVLVCGTSLGLGADGHDLGRHRMFETSFPFPLFTAPPCRCGGRPVLGIYGDRAKTSRGASLSERSSRWSRPESLAVGSEAMQIDWMTWRELREAIPPAMTELIGHQLLQHIRAEARAA